MTEVVSGRDANGHQQDLLTTKHSVSRAIIIDCDVADGLPSVGEFGPDGRRWDAAWVLVRLFSEPIGLLKLEMPDGGLAPEALARAIEREYLPTFLDRLDQAAVPWPGAIPTGGIQPGRLPAAIERRELAMRHAPSITVAICTRNRPQGVGRLLESLVAQSHAPTHVLVVDNAPHDEELRRTIESFQDRLHISCIEEPRPGLAWARNTAIEVSDTEVIAFLDDDEVCDPLWFAEIARGFVEQPTADAVCGAILPAELDTPAQWWFESYGGHSKHRGLTPTVFSPNTRKIQNPLYPLPPFGTGANMAFRREALDRIGWFDVALGAGTLSMGGEDTAALCLVLYGGGTIVYQPSSIVFHLHRREAAQLHRVFLGYGRGLTAFYSSVIIRHPKAVLELVRLTGRAARDLTSREGVRLSGLDQDFPKSFLRANLRGLIEGPAMYLWARRRARRLRRLVPLTTAPSPSAVAPAAVAADQPARLPGPRPIKLTSIDIDDVPAEISAAHPSGGRYHGLWLLVRVDGEPRGLLTLQFDGSATLTREEIEPYLRPIRASVAHIPPVPAVRTAPPITVIVCSTFARLDGLRRCLKSLHALDYPAYDVLVVDNRAEAGALPEWFDGFPLVRVLHEPQPGLAAARNCGLAAAEDEIVAFTDDDVMVDPGWLSAIARRFDAHPEEVSVTGLTLPAELETQAQATFEEYYGGFGPRVFLPVTHRLTRARGRNWFRTPTVAEIDDLGHEVSTFLVYEVGHLGTGANMAFRTQVLREQGGFDVRLGAGTPSQGGEDVDMLVRLIWDGHSLGYDPGALVYHSHRGDDAALRHQVATFGTSYTATLAALMLDDPSHVGAIVATLPQGIRRMGALFQHRLRSETLLGPSTIPDLARLELLSMLSGPAAYVRSWRRVRRSGS